MKTTANQIKLATLCTLALAISACGDGTTTNNPGSVTISGTPLEGQTMSATVSDPDGIFESSLTYQWRSGNSPIDGANSSTLVLGNDQVGDPVSVVARYEDEAGFTEIVLSNSSADVERLVVNFDGQVSISGDPFVGAVLSSEVTDQNGLPETITYQWMADGQAITDATMESYTLTANEVDSVVSLMVTYTDAEGFGESLVSNSTDTITVPAANVEATLTIAGSDTLVVGEQVVVTLADPNGATNANTFVWSADGVVIDDASGSTYSPVTADLGKVLSVSIDFTDDDGFNESVSASAEGIVHTFVTEGLSDLMSAAVAAVDGDIIGLANGDYANTDADAVANAMVFAANSLTIQLTNASTAVLSGPMCLDFTGNNTVIDGLQFASINTLNGSSCASSGGSAVTLRGDGIVFQNNVFDSEESGRDVNTDFSWIALRGVGNTITRNSFTDSTGQKALTGGGVISVYSNTTDGENQDHMISYNLFKDFPDQGDASNRDGSAYMIQLGRSTGNDSQGTLNTTVQYNLFKNVIVDRRFIKVQSGGNTIDSNTFLDGSGMIALEDGNNNTASNNIIISTMSDNSDDGGISYGPFGHTITNNYIAGLRTTSGDRAGLYANSGVITNSGNATSTITAVTVANNSIFNSREAVEFGSRDCDAGAQFIVDFDNNLVANGEAGENLGLESNGGGREAIQDDCDIDPSSDFDNNHFYSRDSTNSGNPFFANFAGAMNNIEGEQGAADIVQGANLLWQGQNADAGIGADVSALTFLTEADVGPGSAQVAQE